ncbi:hypothetical protein BJY28_002977 [Janibacter alkaliphilus]|uniref:Uncharacterized protein n=1 Tax=Janibacter alkaliphilus TaxID=1069963 RepID=A0A852X7W1_9MICO|nr:hypothetical protein [Janibacter alkaliphilus]
MAELYRAPREGSPVPVATPSRMTPTAWQRPSGATSTAPSMPLRVLSARPPRRVGRIVWACGSSRCPSVAA